MGERVLKSVSELGEEAGFVEELRGLQVAEPAAQFLFGQLTIACRRAKGTSVPMTAAVWKRRLFSGGSRSMRAASTACTVAGTGTPGGGGQPIGPRATPRTPVSTRVRTLSSRKKGLPSVPRNEQRCEGCQARVIPQQGREERLGAGRRQRIEPQLGVVGSLNLSEFVATQKRAK